MKIAAIAPSQVPSRTANSIQVMKTCSAMVQLGHQVCLWVPGSSSTGWEQLEAQYGLPAKFTVEWLPSIRWLRRYDFTLKALAKARKWKADLIYTWLPQVSVLALERKIPSMLEMHDLPTGIFGPMFFKRFVRMPGKKRLLVITEALRSKLEELAGNPFEENEVAITPNGVEVERFSNQSTPTEARKRLHFSEKTTAVFSGHFYAGRGTPLLFELAKRTPEIHFLWVGGRDSDISYWRDRIQNENIDNINLTGFVPNQDLPLYLAAGDILLMPYERSISGSSGGNSADICSPMKMFEYMATGRVILSSDLSVIHEVLNESNACFCFPDDIDSWLSALEKLVHNPQLRNSLGKQAQVDVEKYTWRVRAENALKGF